MKPDFKKLKAKLFRIFRPDLKKAFAKASAACEKARADINNFSKTYAPKLKNVHEKMKKAAVKSRKAALTVVLTAGGIAGACLSGT